MKEKKATTQSKISLEGQNTLFAMIRDMEGDEEDLVHLQDAIISYNVTTDDLNNIRDRLGQSLLHTAISFKNSPFVKLLVEKYSADVNVLNKKGESPLHIAAKVKDVDIAKYLIEHKTDVNIKDNFGYTSLDLAEAVHAPGVVEILKCCDIKEIDPTPIVKFDDIISLKTSEKEKLSSLITEDSKNLQENTISHEKMINLLTDVSNPDLSNPEEYKVLYMGNSSFDEPSINHNFF